MSPEASLGYRFAKAVLARSADADEVRREIVSRWGRKALGALSINIVTTRAFPMLRHALGHGESCQRVEVAGIAIVPGKLAHA